MQNLKTVKKAWTILDARERRNAGIVALVMFVTAVFSALTVASILPFLSVLADPDIIREQRVFSMLYAWGGFETDRGFLIALGVASMALIILNNALQIVKVYVIARYATMRTHSISSRLLGSYLRRPYLFFLSQNTGDIGAQILAETQQITERCIRPAAEIFAAVLTLICMIALLLYVEPVISLTAFLVISIIYGAISVVSRRHVRRLAKIRVDANRGRFRISGEALSGIKDIKQLSREQFYLDRYGKPSIAMARAAAQTSMVAQIPQYVIMAVTFSGIILLCLVLIGGSEGMSPQDSVGDIVPTLGFIAFAGQRIMPELSKLYLSATLLTSSGPVVESIHAELRAPREESALPMRPPAAMGLKVSLSFENVSFVYPNSDRAGLRDVSLNIQAGERIGIVGSTGSGKTTLANILLGLIQSDTGRIVVDGQPVTLDNRRAWQATIGYVPQDIFLTDASVLENIAFGRLKVDIDREKVREAARIAQIDDFIVNELDQGYDTEIGERGVRLSGGQRQRIGIARAMYNDADLILFDEATSALDNATEQEVMRSINTLPGDKTLVMIAHRLSTLKSCDRILILHHGEVLGFDNWEALERDCAQFREMASGAGF
ncbi:MAG: ABC transporter ATP-binding protein [Mameliella sp.]|nr:ABC transporter ATP-binding protein [Mameliella sp.]